MINDEILQKAFEEMKTKGISTVLKEILKDREVKKIFAERIRPVKEQFIANYSIQNTTHEIEDTTLKVRFELLNAEDAERMTENIREFVETLRTHILLRMVIREYGIKRIRCESDNSSVILVIEGNEKFIEVLNEVVLKELQPTEGQPAGIGEEDIIGDEGGENHEEER